MAANLSKADMQDLAAFFAEQKLVAIEFTADPAHVKLGTPKVQETLCSMCYLGDLKGQNEIRKLSWQHDEYTLKQLTDFNAHHRTNDAGIMSSVSKTLSDQDIINLAYYATTLSQCLNCSEADASS